MKLEVSADSIDDLINYLKTFTYEIRTGTRKGVSGGYSTGSIYEITEDDSITHESWETELYKYVDTLESQ